MEIKCACKDGCTFSFNPEAPGSHHECDAEGCTRFLTSDPLHRHLNESQGGTQLDVTNADVMEEFRQHNMFCVEHCTVCSALHGLEGPATPPVTDSQVAISSDLPGIRDPQAIMGTSTSLVRISQKEQDISWIQVLCLDAIHLVLT